MKTCRLIFTEKYNRESFYRFSDTYELPYDHRPFNDYKSWKWSMVNDYKVLCVSGGEPMLFPQELIAFIKRFHGANKWDENTIMYLYTAKCDDLEMFMRVLDLFDGVTLTLHNQNDIASFEHLNNLLNLKGPYNKSCRLNIFGDIVLPDKPYPLWSIEMNRIYLPLEDDMKVMRHNYEGR